MLVAGVDNLCLRACLLNALPFLNASPKSTLLAVFTRRQTLIQNPCLHSRVLENMESTNTAILVEDVAPCLACNSRPSRIDNLDAISAVPLDRWDTEATGEAVGARFGGFVGFWAEFDAGVFGISPSEAAFLDPAHRVLLQVIYPSRLLTNERPL